MKRNEKIAKENLKIERFELPRAEALELMKDEPYKVELINDLPEDATISFYKQGDFVDLCAGPHVNYTSKVKAYKLLSATGAYWRGNEKNKMLQRIYGTAFLNKADLEAHLEQLEEAKNVTIISLDVNLNCLQQLIISVKVFLLCFQGCKSNSITSKMG